MVYMSVTFAFTYEFAMAGQTPNDTMSKMYVIKRDGTRQEVHFDKITERIAALCGDLDQVDPVEVAQATIHGLVSGMSTAEIDDLAVKECAMRCSTHPQYGSLAGRISASNVQKLTPKKFSECARILATCEPSPAVTQEFYEVVLNNADAFDAMIKPERDLEYNAFSFETLRRSYLLRGTGDVIVETPQYMHMRIAVALHGNDVDRVRETYELLSTRQYVHSSPTIFNAGTPKGQLASCFLLTVKDDSIDGIYSTLKDCATISKHAGGIGLSVHDIRCRGSYIAGTRGYSTGLVPMLRNFAATAEYVNQGGRRNGAFSIFLEPHHPDIFEFLDLRKNSGAESARARSLFTALWISDLFMERVKAGADWALFDPHTAPGLSEVYGDEFKALYERYESEGRAVRVVKAKAVFKAAIESIIETGTPYMCAKDSINRKTNQANLGTIKSSNLCVAPETKILTDTGYHIISDLEDQEVNVWNGEEWSTTTVRKTGTNQKLIKVACSDGSILECTEYHRFYVKHSVDPVQAKDLSPGAELIDLKTPDGVVSSFKVVSVTDEGRVDDTYCFKEEKRGMGVFNGILTGQCVEITQFSGPNDHSVCNLASINLSAFAGDSADEYDYKGLERVAGIAVRNLNKVIDATHYPTPEAKHTNERDRPLGLGVSGLSDVFFKARISFDCEVARDMNRKIFETIYFGAVKASIALAKELGKTYDSYQGSPMSKGVLQFDMWEDFDHSTLVHDWEPVRKDLAQYGIYNSQIVALMPTATSATVIGVGEAFEPQGNNIYKRKVMSGEFIVVNKYLVDELVEMGIWSDDVRRDIILNGGSIAKLEGVSSEFKERYRTVWEIKMRSVIDMAADRAPFVCQSQSMNLFIENPSVHKLSNVYNYAHSKHLKTLSYYVRSKAATNANEGVKKVTDECLSCSA